MAEGYVITYPKPVLLNRLTTENSLKTLNEFIQILLRVL